MSRGAEFEQKALPRVGLVVAFIFASLTVLLWPPLVDKVVALNWQVADMHLAAYGLQVIFGVLAVTSSVARHRIDACCARMFASRTYGVFALLTVALSVIGSLTAVEIAFRLVQLPFNPMYAPSEHALARFDPELGWSYVPNRSTVQRLGTAQRPVSITFDEIGARV